MVWNKTSKELESKIVEELKKNTLTKDIIKLYNVSYSVISRLMKDFLSEDEIRKGYSKACTVGKLGSKNPMYGKTGELHHNHTKNDCLCAGYKTCFVPTWWKGRK